MLKYVRETSPTASLSGIPRPRAKTTSAQFAPGLQIRQHDRLSRERTMTSRSVRQGCALLALAALLAMAEARVASAQSQITIVVSVAAGGSSDIGMRTIATKVSNWDRAS
jgi:hypothetical protein